MVKIGLKLPKKLSQKWCKKVDQNLFGHPVVEIGVKIEFDIPE